MNRALVVGAAPALGEEGFYRELLASARFVVAADAAGEWCASLGRVPDAVVGDFDSSVPGAAERLAALGAHIEHHPAAKDSTDLELAVAYARRHRGGPLCLTAAFSDRLDHTLAALGVLANAGPDACAIEPSWRAWTCSPAHGLRVALDPGATFTLMAVEPCEGVTALGGEWPLVDEALQPLSGRGVSNEAVAGEVSVTVRSGRLLLIVNDRET